LEERLAAINLDTRDSAVGDDVVLDVDETAGRNRGADVRLEVALPATLRGWVAPKGSIALDGVSLTVAAVKSRSFEVALIPETLARTKLGGLRPGDALNVEADLVARYLETLMQERRGAAVRRRPRTRRP
jgi:riboflavin synthase alpha subunit